MTAECRAYLPAYHTVTIFHLRDLVGNKRRIIKCDDVKYINIPFFEGLANEDIIEYVTTVNNGSDLMALPEPEKELLKIPREYLSNVVYTVVGDPFQNWVNQRINARNQKVTKEQNLAIQMDPVIAELFRHSTSVSVSKGISGNLMKETAKVSKSLLFFSF